MINRLKLLLHNFDKNCDFVVKTNDTEMLKLASAIVQYCIATTEHEKYIAFLRFSNIYDSIGYYINKEYITELAYSLFINEHIYLIRRYLLAVQIDIIIDELIKAFYKHELEVEVSTDGGPRKTKSNLRALRYQQAVVGEASSRVLALLDL